MAALCCIFAGKMVALLVCTVQAVLCIFISSYVVSLGSVPSLSVAVDNANLMYGFKIDQLADYLSVKYFFIATALYGIQCICARFIYEKSCVRVNSRGRMTAFLSCVGILFAAHYIVSIESPIKNLTLRYEEAEAKKANFKNFIFESVVRRGYCATALAELISGRMSESRSEIEQTCSGERAMSLPVPQVTDKIIIIQVESLGSNLIDTKVNNEYIMPFLKGLQATAMVLRMDGAKKLASANSDYELLNTRIARDDRLYYQSVSIFYDSIIKQFSARNVSTAVWHGVTGEYMSLRSAYTGMGFSQLNFKEELQNAGLPVQALGFGGIISDNDLLQHVSKNIPDEKFLYFIVTMTMHFQSRDLLPQFASDAHGKFYSECRRTDDGLRMLFSALPDGATVIIYGDHKPYFVDSAPEVPFIIAVKGRNMAHDTETLPVLTRCEMSHYMRRVFHLPAPRLSAGQCPRQ